MCISASAVPAVCLVAVSLLQCQEGLIFALMGTATMLMGGMFSGFLSNHIDIAPQFAGNKFVGILELRITVIHCLIEMWNGRLHADFIDFTKYRENHIKRALYSVNKEEHFFLLEKINFHVHMR